MTVIVTFAFMFTAETPFKIWYILSIFLRMASIQKKGRAHWDCDEETKLIEGWAEILEQTDGR